MTDDVQLEICQPEKAPVVRGVRSGVYPVGADDDNKIVLMVRDPWTLFTYWEVNSQVEERTKEEIARKGLVISKSILRVYEVVGTASGDQLYVVFDFDLKDWAKSWYIHADNPGKRWKTEIGILCTTGEFFCLASSNIVQAPPYGMSNIYDEDWMCTDDEYYKLFAVAGGYGIGTSSLQMKEILERHLEGGFFSGGVTSGMFGSINLFNRKQI